MYRNRNINPDTTLLDALKKMDSLCQKLLIIEEQDAFIGLLSAGDIQRAIIKGISLNGKVSSILRKEIRVARPDDEFESIKQMMLDYRMELCPLIGSNQKILDVYYWEDLFLEQKPWIAKKFNIPVVIMAGGKGSRLKPLTNVLPKPLIPIGDKTILEDILELFSMHGCDKYYVSINYKAELIKYYINSLSLPYKIMFMEEMKPLGTAGSLSLLKGKIDQTFFVTNCDILIKHDYSEILDFHKEQENEITIVSAIKYFPVKYGTIETGDNGHLINLIEKPELTFQINSGMYIFEPHLIDEISSDENMDITDFIMMLKQKNHRIGVYPVSQSSWTDIGDWKVYLSVLEKSSSQTRSSY